jgi:hypothetical protein
MTTNTNDESPDHLNAVNNLVAKIKGDGCTAAPDFHYRHCCDEHDIAYVMGTDENYKVISKWEADKRLFLCMYRKSKTPIGKFIISPLYWLAVSTFGLFFYYGKARKLRKF